MNYEYIYVFGMVFDIKQLLFIRIDFLGYIFIQKEDTMGIFKRLSDIIAANINDLLDRAENPSKMIKQIILEMEDHVAEIRTAVAKAIATEKTLKKQLDERQHSCEEWERKAVIALEKDNEDLARKALEKKRAVVEQIPSLEVQYEAAKASSDSLNANLKQIEEKLKIAKRKQSTLLARQRAAEAQQKIHKSIASAKHTPDPFGKFERMQDKISAMEAEAEAYNEMSIQKSAVEVEFEKLEAKDAIDLEMSELKKKVGKKSGEKK